MHVVPAPYIRRFLAILIPIVCLALPLSAGKLQVVAWNIEWFPGGQLREVTREMELGHMERAQARVKAMNPDIFLSSEIRDWKAFDELVSVVPGLQTHVVSSYRDRDTGRLWPQQLAIASKLEVRAAWFEPWRPTMWGNPRGFAFAALEDPSGEGLILVYALHLKSNRASTDEQAQANFNHRNESIRQILQHVEEMETIVFPGEVKGVIVGGDINTCHDGRFADEVVARLVKAGFVNTWKDTPREKRLTWRGSDFFEATTFDYIFVRDLPSNPARMIQVRADESDHHAVSVSINLK